MQRPTKAHIAAFKRVANETLVRMGASKTLDCAWYEWSIQTSAGLLNINVYDTWLACRFDDVAAANRVLPGCVNKFSGKWNHHFTYEELRTIKPEDLLGGFERQVKKLQG